MAKYTLPKWQEPTYDEKALRQRAEDAINPQYNAQLAGIESERNIAQNQYDTTRSNLIDDYAKRVLGIETDTILGKNTYANNINSRGLGRSSIAMGGLEDIGIRGEKRIDETNTERDARINEAQGILNTILQNLINQETMINTNRETAVRDYINQLKEKQYQKARDSYQMEYQRISDLIAQQERQKALKQQSRSGGSSSSSKSKNTVKNLTLADVRSVINGIARDTSITPKQKNAIINQFVADNPSIKKDSVMMNYIGSFKDDLLKGDWY